MTQIRVWAPKAQQVALNALNRLVNMRQTDSGWWEASESGVQHGTDYAFIIDGEGPFPDPRSPWQPAGIHGPSRWVDHDRFQWSDAGWQPPSLEKALVYEVHIGTFTAEGTFEAAIKRLDYLAELGVTHVEIMPVAEFSGNHGWGYDGVDLYAPHHAYGGPEGLKKLVDACHYRGLAVLMDVVYNHLGPSGNYLSKFGPYFTHKHVTPWGDAVNLDDADSDEVRRFFIDNALMWLRDYHIDGLRLDAIHALVDESAVHFLEQLATEVKQLGHTLGRELVLIAESNLNDPRLVRPSELGGYGLDSQWSDDFHHALHTVLTGENASYYGDFGRLEDLAKAIEDGFVYDGRYSVTRRRVHGRPAKGLPGHAFLICLQNHDQVGNRAVGERTSHLLNTSQLKLGAAVLLTAPYLPMLFQGEEWAASSPFLYFTDHQEADLGEAVRKGRQGEFAAFGWNPDEVPNPQADNTFLRSKLNWNELDQEPHRSLLEWHKALIQLRNELPVVTDNAKQTVTVQCDEQARWLLMERGPLTLVCNFAGRSQQLDSPRLTGKRLQLASETEIELSGQHIHLPAYSAALLWS